MRRVPSVHEPRVAAKGRSTAAGSPLHCPPMSAAASLHSSLVPLGPSSLRVTPICLGTMTFGEQVDEAAAHRILDRSLELGINFIDTAEVYSVPTRRETYGATERFIGNWLAARPGARAKIVLATKIAGPARGMDWVRGGKANVSKDDFVQACDDSLARLKTETIDLYQIHWPIRNTPLFGGLYFDPAKDAEFTSIHAQLEALAGLVKAGKVRHVGVSNETPWGVGEFVRIAEQHGLPRIVSQQNPYALVNRVVDNGLDETLHRSSVSLLGYSPLGFGMLSGKYDTAGFEPDANGGRIARYESVRKQRWGRPEALAAARKYNALAREHGLTPTRMALAFCYTSWRVASTIIGVTTLAQLDENLDAWGTRLDAAALKQIDAIRWTHRDPAQ